MRLLFSLCGGALMAFSLLWFMAGLIAKPLPAPSVIQIERELGSFTPKPDKPALDRRPSLPAAPPAMQLPKGIDEGDGIRGQAGDDEKLIAVGPVTPGAKFSPIDMNWTRETLPVEPGTSDSLLPMFQPAPQYPPDALRQAQEGWVRLRIEVAPDGHVADAEVLLANPKRVFDRAAVNAVKNWRYRPRDSSLTQTVEVEVAFTLEK